AGAPVGCLFRARSGWLRRPSSHPHHPPRMPRSRQQAEGARRTRGHVRRCPGSFRYALSTRVGQSLRRQVAAAGWPQRWQDMAGRGTAIQHEGPLRPAADPKLRVLFVTRKWPPAVGGMEVYCRELVNELDERVALDLEALPGRSDGQPPSTLALVGFGV